MTVPCRSATPIGAKRWLGCARIWKAAHGKRIRQSEHQSWFRCGGKSNMACNDLRSFLKLLEENHQLVRISEPVWPEADIGAAASAANKGIGETAPALIFDNIRGFAQAQ